MTGQETAPLKTQLVAPAATAPSEGVKETATKKLRQRVRELTGRRQSGKDVKQIIAEPNPVLRGWGNYFRRGTADREFNKIDAYVVRSLRRWQYRRGGQRQTKRPMFTRDQLYGITPRRSSLSRVPENGTHDLKGDTRNGLA